MNRMEEGKKILTRERVDKRQDQKQMKEQRRGHERDAKVEEYSG